MTLHRSPTALVRRPVSVLAAVVALAALSLRPETAAAQSFPQHGAYGYRAPVTRGFFRHHHRAAPVVVYVQPTPQRTVYVQPTPGPRFVRPCAPPAPPSVAPVVAPPPADEHGYLVLATTPLAVGQLVRASWGASYFSAQVTAVNADGTVGIHYVGYSEMWNETVPRTSLRLPR